MLPYLSDLAHDNRSIHNFSSCLIRIWINPYLRWHWKRSPRYTSRIWIENTLPLSINIFNFAPNSLLCTLSYTESYQSLAYLLKIYNAPHFYIHMCTCVFNDALEYSPLLITIFWHRCFPSIGTLSTMLSLYCGTLTL